MSEKASPGSSLALLACEICKQRKKRCDKALPACGPCERFDRNCRYPSPHYDSAGEEDDRASLAANDLALRQSPQLAQRGLQRLGTVCEPCKRGKRKCDKTFPECGRCTRLGIRCTYEVPYHNAERFGESQIVSEQPAGITTEAVSSVPLRIAALNPPKSYPVADRWYIPILLQHFRERFGMSIVKVNPKSMAYRLQTVWMRRSIGDPCLFHATLYAASAHLDASRGDHDNPVTLHHHTELVRHVRQRLADPEHKKLDEAIGAVIPLAFFSYVLGDYASSKAHLEGLLGMTAARGGLDQLGLDGLLSGLIRLSAMIFSIVFDADPVSGLVRTGWAELPCPSPIRLISRIAKEELTMQAPHHLPGSTQDVFRDIYDVSFYLNKVHHEPSDARRAQLIFDKWRYRRQMYMQTLKMEPVENLSVDYDETLSKPAQLAAMLFFGVLDSNIGDHQCIALRRTLVADLKASLAGKADVMWLKAAPSAFSWVCLTGAAASEDSSNRGWFYFRQGSMARAFNVDDSSLIQDSWSYFHWLRDIVRKG